MYYIASLHILCDPERLTTTCLPPHAPDCLTLVFNEITMTASGIIPNFAPRQTWSLPTVFPELQIEGDQPLLDRITKDVELGGQSELAHQVLAMGFHGTCADHQDLADLGIRPAFGNHLQDLPLPRRNTALHTLFEIPSFDHRVEHLVGQGLAEVTPALADGLNCLGQQAEILHAGDIPVGAIAKRTNGRQGGGMIRQDQGMYRWIPLLDEQGGIHVVRRRQVGIGQDDIDRRI